MDTATPSEPSLNFKVVITFGMVMIILNGLCTLYVLSRTLGRWYATKKSLPMALRVPFYIAITDLLIFSINFPNLLHPNLYAVPWSGLSCKIIGALTSFAISTNMTLVGLLAFLTYLRICRKMYINLGRYDYKAILFILFTSLIYTLISIPSYGSGKYWCFSNSTVHILPIVTLTLNLIVLFITIVSYSLTLREINSIRFINEQSRIRERENNNNNGVNRTRSILNRSYYNNNDAMKNVRRIEPIVVRKIIGYVLIFIIQWTPPMIYVVGQIINYEPMWVYLITDATVNMGGMGNLIQFIINEGWRDRYTSPSSKRSSASSSFAGVSPESIVPTPPLHLLPRILTSSESNFEIMIKIDTTTSIDFGDFQFSSENDGKLRPNSASSTITDTYSASSEAYLLNTFNTNPP